MHNNISSQCRHLLDTDREKHNTVCSHQETKALILSIPRIRTSAAWLFSLPSISKLGVEISSVLLLLDVISKLITGFSL